MKSLKGIIEWESYDTRDGKITVMEILNRRQIRIFFHEPYFETWAFASAIRLGTVKNRIKPIIYGVGFIGVGPYRCKDINNNLTKSYNTWRDMLRRVHKPSKKSDARNYSDVSIVNEWYNFQNFAEWFENNIHPDWKNHDWMWQLDKDLLIPGNRIYSPNTCCIVPIAINSIFSDSGFARGKMPMGITQRKERFIAQGPGNQYIGIYDTMSEAYTAYWNDKFRHIQQVATKFQDYIPVTVRNRLLNFGWEEALEYYGQDVVLGVDTK